MRRHNGASNGNSPNTTTALQLPQQSSSSSSSSNSTSDGVSSTVQQHQQCQRFQQRSPNSNTTRKLGGGGGSCKQLLQQRCLLLGNKHSLSRCWPKKKTRKTRCAIFVVATVVTTLLVVVVVCAAHFMRSTKSSSTSAQNNRETTLTAPVADRSLLTTTRATTNTTTTTSSTAAVLAKKKQPQLRVATAARNTDPPLVKGSPPLLNMDYEQFTVRINTWQREEQLQLSIRHHLTCPSVAQVQVVWCAEQGPVPAWLLSLASAATEQRDDDNSSGGDRANAAARVVVEVHAVNSLNERFAVLPETVTPTAAILSADDDVIRPCLALESAFRKWTRNPDRQVGFDARSHQVVNVVNNNDQSGGNNNNNNMNPRWKYAYMSTTEKSNAYSLTLTRYSFLHRDYLTSYMRDMPARIRETVAANFNCEDIAMSLWISSRTRGRPPLLADQWAVKSQIKMHVAHKISGGDQHKNLRDDCVNDFAELLHLKKGSGRLEAATLRHGDFFDYGAPADDWNVDVVSSQLSSSDGHNRGGHSHSELAATVQRWKEQGQDVLIRELSELRMEASRQIFDQGLIEKTQPWKDRFHPKDKAKKVA